MRVETLRREMILDRGMERMYRTLQRSCGRCPAVLALDRERVPSQGIPCLGGSVCLPPPPGTNTGGLFFNRPRGRASSISILSTRHQAMMERYVIQLRRHFIIRGEGRFNALHYGVIGVVQIRHSTLRRAG